MTDIDRHGSVASALAAALCQYGRNRSTLFDWMHPDWRGEALAQLPPAASHAAQLARLRGVDAWLQAAGVGVPPLHMFKGERGVLASLSVDAALCAMRLRALHFRRAELRYWVDRDSRDLLAHWLGGEGSGVLRWLMEIPNAPALDRLMRSYGMPALDELDDLELAWEGYCLFAHVGLCGPTTPLALLRFVWSSDAVESNWFGGDEITPHADDCSQIIRRLPDLFKERT